MHPSSDGATSPPPLRLVRSRWQLTAGLGASLLLAAASALLLVRHADRLAATAYPLLVLVLGVLWAVLLRAFVLSHRRQARLLHDMQSQAALLKETRRIAGIGDWTWELDTGRVHWSDEVYRIHGQAPRADGLHIDALGAWIHPEDRDRVESYFTRMLANGDAMEAEYRIVRPDGEVRTVHARGEWSNRTDGQRAMRGIQQDITALASVRDRLRITQAEYAFLFEHNPLPMWVFDRESLRFLAVNASMVEHYGYAREDLLDATILDIRPPETVEAVRAEALLATRERSQGQVWKHMRKDGSELRAAIHTRDIEFDGRAARLVLAQDVTERERTEQRFRLIAGATSDAAWDWDVATGALWWSDSFYSLFGHARDDIPQRVEGWDALVHGDDRARVHAGIAAALASTADEWEDTYRFRRGDGSYAEVLDRGFLLRDANGRVVRAAGGMLDVTRRKRDEADLRLLRRAVEATDSGILIVDMRSPDMPAVYANGGFQEMTGYDAADIIGHDCRFLRSDPRDAEQRAAIRDALRDRAELRVLLRSLRRDGSSFWNDFYMAPVRDDDGLVTHMVSVCNDVSERERNEERFQLIARATSDAVWDWDFIKGTTWRSDNVYALFGYGPGEFGPNLKAWEELLHPDDRERVMDSVMRGAESAASEWECDYRLRRKDGSYADVRDRGFIVRDMDGRAVRALGGMLDVTQRNRDEVNLRLLRRAVEATDNGIVIADARQPDFPIVYANSAFEEITGYAAAEMIGRNCRVLQGDDRSQAGVDVVRQALREQREARVLLRNYRKDGTLFWNDFHVAPVSDDTGTLSHFVGVLSDVSDRQRYEEQLAYRATHDELTGLPNRQLLQDRLQQSILNAERYGREAAVVFVDMDDFKLVNDSLGHGAGDIALKAIAARLQGAVRDTDTVGRFGGDEFVIVLTEQTDDAGMEQAIERITAALVQPIELAGVAHVLTPSIGYCRYPEAGGDAESLLKHADLAMYEAKRQGRNRAIGYRSEFDMVVSQRLQLVSRLREALQNGEFRVAFQPLFDPAGGVVALEALARWQHPERGLLPPSEFISVCEESGLIVGLGRFMLREAARHHALLAAVGLGHVRLAVNVSAGQFNHELYRDVAAAVSDFALPAGVLELELTESVIMDNPERAIETMNQISALGVCISVDDFGTGYSSLAYLKRLPIDRLKIDRSFVQDLGHDADDAAICASIIGLGHLMELRIVAEGVETEQQAAWLRERGCDELQGFLLGRPQPFDTLLPQLLPGAALV
jgi:diguanylate cyclase (GGDEF)-like protein/PAS domain S-box-containing protein